MSKSRPPLFLIGGPTASGKSALALEWAKRSGGVIVNADASQVYRDIPILSAAPDASELAAAEHRLFGTRDGAQACSAADYAMLAKDAIAEAHEAGRPALLVGGTGLYLRTLLDGIAPVPAIDPGIRAEVRAADVATNRAVLERLDPEAAARLKPADTQRIARALEVVVSTGKTLGDWQKVKEGGIADSVTLHPLILLPPREWLIDRCDRRFAWMLDHGAVEEVDALLARKLDPDLPVMRAIGVPEVAAMLRGDMSREEAIAAGQVATRQYAKRQYTWFSNQPPAQWPRLREVHATEAALALLHQGD
jgi:tRNA dimethylallyltransferase